MKIKNCLKGFIPKRVYAPNFNPPVRYLLKQKMDIIGRIFISICNDTEMLGT